MLRFSQTAITCLATFLLTGTCFAQSFRIDSKDPQQVNPGDSFSSIDGRFAVALPKQISGYTPNVTNTPNGQVETITFEWRTAAGMFVIGYIDRPETVEGQSARVLNNLRDNIVKGYVDGGKLTSESDLSLDGHPGRQLNFELTDGGVTTLRLFIAKNRIYQTIATLTSTEKSKQPAALKILDTFKLLSEEQANALLSKKVEQATPPALPQLPAPKRAKTDAADKGLKGKVKSVATESAGISESVTGTRKPVSVDTFDENGNFVKRIAYDYRGHPDEITVYGFLDGNRVSISKWIEYEYNPPPMALPADSKPKTAKPDPRFTNKLKYDYDPNGRLVENASYGNDGGLRVRYTYKYKDGQKEEVVYDGDGKVLRKYVYTVDDKGMETAREAYDIKDAKVTESVSYKYEFDAQGNWIKRTTLGAVTKDGKTDAVERSVDYRTITYF